MSKIEILIKHHIMIGNADYQAAKSETIEKNNKSGNYREKLQLAFFRVREEKAEVVASQETCILL